MMITGTKNYSNEQEKAVRGNLLENFKNCPIPEDQILQNLGLFLNSKDL